MAINAKRYFNGKVARVFDTTTNQTHFKASIGSTYFEDFIHGGQITATDSAGITPYLYVGNAGSWGRTAQGSGGANPQAVDPGVTNGAYRLQLDTTANVQRAYLNHADTLSFDATNGLIWECRAKITAGSLAGGGVVLGLIGQRLTHTLDNIAQNVWFRFAANFDALCESDDGTNDNDDVATGVTAVTNTYNVYRIELYPTANSVREARFFIDGVRVGSSTTFDIVNYSACTWQPHFELQNPTGSALGGTTQLDIDYCGMLFARN